MRKIISLFIAIIILLGIVHINIFAEGNVQNENIEMFDEEEVVDGFRSAIQNTIDKMAGVETFFTGRQSSECRIEPIAIYREL